METYCVTRKMSVISMISSVILFVNGFIFGQRNTISTKNMLVEAIIYFIISYSLYIQSNVMGVECDTSNINNTRLLFFIMYLMPIILLVVLHKFSLLLSPLRTYSYILLIAYIIIGVSLLNRVLYRRQCSTLQNGFLQWGFFKPDYQIEKILMIIFILLFSCILALQFKLRNKGVDGCILKWIETLAIPLSFILSLLNNGKEWYTVFGYVLTMIISVRPFFAILYI